MGCQFEQDIAVGKWPKVHVQSLQFVLSKNSGILIFNSDFSHMTFDFSSKLFYVQNFFFFVAKLNYIKLFMLMGHLL